MGKSIIPQVVEMLQQFPALEKKCDNMRKAMVKKTFEKVFWQRKCKFYAPNKIEDHYKELDAELLAAGLIDPPGPPNGP